MFRRKFLAAVSAGLMMLGFSACAVSASAQKPILIRVTNQLPPSSAMSKGLELWKSLVEEGTHGRVKVELYPSGQLYKDRDVIAAVQNKSIEAGLVVAGQFTSYDPIFASFDLPGLFVSYGQGVRALKGDVGKDFSRRLEKLGVYPLYWALQGFVEIATLKTPIVTPASMKGMKLRVHSKELARMAQLVGAVPITVASSEVSTAISQGMVDGITTSVSSYDARKWYEGAPFITDTKSFGLIGIAIIINDDLWNGLPADIKSVIAQASQTASEKSTEQIVKEEQEILAQLGKKGVKVSRFDGDAKTQFKTQVQPLYKAFYDSTGEPGRDLVKYVESVK